MYDMPLYRPPSEGDNLIIQATLGCSFNQCSFCSMYKEKAFVARPLDEVFAHIDEMTARWPDAHRVFLADGDALTLPMAGLRAILDRLHAALPNLQRVSCYATPINLLKKTPDELAELRERKLSLVYLGIESGSADILKRITKGASPQGMAEAITKARAAGLKVSATVILGLGGKGRWQDHIDGTAALINKAPPNFLSTLQLHLEPDQVRIFLDKFGEPFTPQDDRGILEEQHRLIAALDPPAPVIFRSNHASNCLALAGTLPKDKRRLLEELNHALVGETALRPQWMRGL